MCPFSDSRQIYKINLIKRERKKRKKIPAKSFDEKKNVKLGYVAAEANDDAHADINAYYLGVKAVCKKVVLQVDT